MSKRAVLVIVFFILLNGCKDTEQAAEVATSAIPKAQQAAAAAAARNAETEIGVAECDAYIQKYEACLDDKVPFEARGQMREQLEQQRQAWRDMAQDDAKRDALAKACSDANTSLAATAMKAYGCNW